MFFAELQERLGPIGSVPCAQGKIGLVLRLRMSRSMLSKDLEEAKPKCAQRNVPLRTNEQ